MTRRPSGRVAARLPLAAAAAGTVPAALLSAWWALPVAVAAFVAGRGPATARSAVLTLTATLAAGAAGAAASPSWLAGAGSLFVAVVAAAGMLPWCLGRFWRHYRALVRDGWEHAERLAREQHLVAREARQRERARIAREMHDALGHDLSLIALSAGALKLSPGLPGDRRDAAEEIRRRAAEATDRLGRIVGLLHEDGEDPADDPAVATVAGVVGGARAAGLTVTCEETGAEPPGGVPPAVARAAARVVREALTNVTRHAPGAPAAVRVAHAPGETTVTVANPAPPAPAPRARGVGGHGLIGLDERVRLLGGSLAAGPRPGGGFAVTARLPHSAPDGSPPPPGVASVVSQRVTARRRTRRSLLVAAALPAAAFAVLTVALIPGWGAATAGAVLPADAFAALRDGTPRADLATVLPADQTPHRLPPGARAGCEHYALTADPLDDRFGDAYELCFEGGVLTSHSVLRW